MIALRPNHVGRTSRQLPGLRAVPAFLAILMAAGCAAPAEEADGDQSALSAPPSADREASSVVIARSIRAAYLAAETLQPADDDSMPMLRQVYPGAASYSVMGRVKGTSNVPLYAVEFSNRTDRELRQAMQAPTGSFRAVWFVQVPTNAPYGAIIDFTPPIAVALWPEPLARGTAPRFFARVNGQYEEVHASRP